MAKLEIYNDLTILHQSAFDDKFPVKSKDTELPDVYLLRQVQGRFSQKVLSAHWKEWAKFELGLSGNRRGLIQALLSSLVPVTPKMDLQRW